MSARRCWRKITAPNVTLSDAHWTEHALFLCRFSAKTPSAQSRAKCAFHLGALLQKRCSTLFAFAGTEASTWPAPPWTSHVCACGKSHNNRRAPTATTLILSRPADKNCGLVSSGAESSETWSLALASASSMALARNAIPGILVNNSRCSDRSANSYSRTFYVAAFAHICQNVAVYGCITPDVPGNVK